MKNILLIPQSLVGNAFKMLMKHIENISDATFLIFKDFYTTVNCGGLEENYKKLLNKLQVKSIPVTELEVYDVNEYFYAHNENNHETVYITPALASTQIISSAALTGYKGSVYVYSSSEDEPIVQNIKLMNNAFSHKNSAGTKGLDTASATFCHVIGKDCNYKLDGKTYYQKLVGRERALGYGVEGYVMIAEDNPDYLIKIWDGYDKQQFEIDKVAKMIAYPYKNSNVAIPLGFVYNDLGNPIGYYMKKLSGEDVVMENMNNYYNCKAIMKEILETVIWMEVHTYEHRDLNHNFKVNSKTGNIGVFDVDSIQFMQYPATASTTDAKNCLPIRYRSNSKYFNTIEISYTTLSFLISCFVKTTDLFGLMDKKTGLCPIYEDGYKELKSKAPWLVELVYEAYVQGRPVSVAKQLSELIKNFEDESRKSPFKLSSSSLKGKTKVFEEKSRKRFVVTLPSEKSEIMEVSENVKEEETDDYIVNEDEKIYTSAIIPPYNTARSTFKTEDMPNTEAHIARDSLEEKNSLVFLFQSLILAMFDMGTLKAGITKADQWDIFIRSGKWKKPVISSIVTIFLIIAMLIAFTQI